MTENLFGKFDLLLQLEFYFVGGQGGDDLIAHDTRYIGRISILRKWAFFVRFSDVWVLVNWDPYLKHFSLHWFTCYSSSRENKMGY